jgi:hypothetical protein
MGVLLRQIVDIPDDKPQLGVLMVGFTRVYLIACMSPMWHFHFKPTKALVALVCHRSGAIFSPCHIIPYENILLDIALKSNPITSNV